MRFFMNVFLIVSLVLFLFLTFLIVKYQGRNLKTFISKYVYYSSSKRKAAFVEKMNEYAKDFGMTNTHFLNASGQYLKGHYSCAKDIMKMCGCCTAYDKLMQIWGQEKYSISVAGKNPRTITGVSTYKGANMTSVGDYYHIFGGKSGTWNFGGSIGIIRNLTLAVKSNMDDSWVIGCVMKSTNKDRGIPFKQLIDWLESYRNDNTTPSPTIEAIYAAAGILPKGNPKAYADVDWMMVGKNAETHYMPASMTKLMTAMVTLDYCDLDEQMVIKKSDIQKGNPIYYEGDIISIHDALLAMLLPSSNTLAVALSRFVGNKILNMNDKTRKK